MNKKYLIVTVTMNKKYLIVTVTMDKKYLIVTLEYGQVLKLTLLSLGGGALCARWLFNAIFLQVSVKDHGLKFSDF